MTSRGRNSAQTSAPRLDEGRGPRGREAAANALRDPTLSKALADAVDGRSYAVNAVLCRASGLPGPRPNLLLAAAVGAEIAKCGRRGDRIVASWLTWDADRAPAGTVEAYLSILAAFALGARYAANVDPKGALEDLDALAADVRAVTRDGVVAALVELARTREDEIIRALAAFCVDYLQASVAVQVTSTREVVTPAHDAAATVDILERSFSLAEAAPRAHQRTQGFRTVVRALAEGVPQVLHRFPEETTAWLVRRANTTIPELREALTASVARAQKLGHAKRHLAEVTRALVASAPVPRDPTAIVHGTRGRGRKKGTLAR